MKSWSTEAVAAPEQFAYWREVVCEAFAALDPRSAERGAGFASRVDMEGIGAINVARIRAEAHTVVRDFSQIRRDPQDRLFVNLQVAGQGIVRQGHRETRVTPGAFSIVDTARPYTLHFDERFEVLSLRVPRELLLPRVSEPRALFARALGGPAGIGRTTSGFMQSLMEGGGLPAGPAAERLAVLLCELVAESARAADAGVAAAPPMRDAHRQLLVRRVKAHVLEALDSPELDVPSIARRFGVSVRYLHLAFAHEGSTPAAWIRAQRMARCAQDLANPADRRPVSAIALRWGFQDIRISRAHSARPSAARPRPIASGTGATAAATKAARASQGVNKPTARPDLAPAVLTVQSTAPVLGATSGRSLRFLHTLSGQVELPRDAEAVLHPAVEPAERIGIDRHQHLAALGQPVEQPPQLRLVVAVDEQRDRGREAEGMHGRAVDAQQAVAAELEARLEHRALGARARGTVALDLGDACLGEQREVEVHRGLGLAGEHQEGREPHGRSP
jgi:AraC family transcriptional activator of tynA and feaB